jgi:hypothetical protein
MQTFFTAYESTNLDLAIQTLGQISSLLADSPFDADNWAFLLKSNFIPLLVTELRPDWPLDLVQAGLLCFASILLYPSWTELQQICTAIPQDVFLDSILTYSEWIDPCLHVPYVRVLSLVARIYCPNVGKAFARITELVIGTLGEENQVGTLGEQSQVGTLWEENQVGTLGEENQVGTLGEQNQVGTLGEQNQVSTIQVLGQMIQKYLSNPRAGTLFSDLILLTDTDFLRGFPSWAVPINWQAVPDDVLICILDGLKIVTTIFPAWCTELYSLPFQEIEADLRHRGDVYGRLRPVLLSILENMATYQPLVKWDMGWRDSFCNRQDSDFGVRGLEVLCLLLQRPITDLGQALNCDILAFDFELCSWFVEELQDPTIPYCRMNSLLRCLCTTLHYVQYNESDAARYHPLFLSVCPVLGDALAGQDICEVAMLAIHIVVLFVDSGHCDGSDLSQIGVFEADGDDPMFHPSLPGFCEYVQDVFEADADDPMFHPSAEDIKLAAWLYHLSTLAPELSFQPPGWFQGDLLAELDDDNELDDPWEEES